MHAAAGNMFPSVSTTTTPTTAARTATSEATKSLLPILLSQSFRAGYVHSTGIGSHRLGVGAGYGAGGCFVNMSNRTAPVCRIAIRRRMTTVPAETLRLCLPRTTAAKYNAINPPSVSILRSLLSILIVPDAVHDKAENLVLIEMPEHLFEIDPPGLSRLDHDEDPVEMVDEEDGKLPQVDRGHVHADEIILFLERRDHVAEGGGALAPDRHPADDAGFSLPAGARRKDVEILNDSGGDRHGAPLERVEEARTRGRAEDLVKPGMVEIHVDEHRLPLVSHRQGDRKVRGGERLAFPPVGARGPDGGMNVMLLFGEQSVVETIVVVERDDFLIDELRPNRVHHQRLVDPDGDARFIRRRRRALFFFDGIL